MDLKLSKDVSTAINIFSAKNQIEKNFIPLLTNVKLKSSFTKLSNESPIFQKSLKLLENTFVEEDCNDFFKRYFEFYSNISGISDELSLIIENVFNKIEEEKLPLVINEKTEYISSKIFLGSMLFLVMTSNEDIFNKSLNRLEAAL